MNKMKVLFLSRDDRAAGAMARALLSQCAGDRFDVDVAGPNPASVDPMALLAMEEAWIEPGDPFVIDACGSCSGSYDFVVTIRSGTEGFPEEPGSLEWLLECPASSGASEKDKLESWRRIRAAIWQKVLELIRFCSIPRSRDQALIGQGMPGCHA